MSQTLKERGVLQQQATLARMQFDHQAAARKEFIKHADSAATTLDSALKFLGWRHVFHKDNPDRPKRGVYGHWRSK